MICPSYSIKFHHLVIDNRMFYYLLRRIGHISTSVKECQIRNNPHYWGRFLSFKRFEVGNNKKTSKHFHFFLKTDGKSVSLCYDMKKVVADDSIVPRELKDFRKWNSNPDINSDDKRRIVTHYPRIQIPRTPNKLLELVHTAFQYLSAVCN